MSCTRRTSSLSTPSARTSPRLALKNNQFIFCPKNGFIYRSFRGGHGSEISIFLYCGQMRIVFWLCCKIVRKTADVIIAKKSRNKHQQLFRDLGTNSVDYHRWQKTFGTLSRRGGGMCGYRNSDLHSGERDAGYQCNPNLDGVFRSDICFGFSDSNVVV